jgi:hypothetical protein
MLCELYFHSIVLPHPYIWNPNTYVGDAQIMDFAYWLRHEELGIVEMKRYKEEELHSPLCIRAKEANIGEFIANNNILSLDKDVTLVWEEKQVEAMEHIEETLRLLGE